MGTTSLMAKDQVHLTENKVSQEELKIKEIQSYDELIKLLESKKEYYDVVARELGDMKTATSMQDVAYSEKASEVADYSSTNQQVEGVDEADRIKVDGRYIYSCMENGVAIVDTKDKMTQIASIKCCLGEWASYNIKKIFLHEDYLVVLMQGRETGKEQSIYDVNGKVFTAVQIYNVANKNNPVLSRFFKVEGFLNGIRMINGQIYMITESRIGAYLNKKSIGEGILPKYCDSVVDSAMNEIPAKGIKYFDWSNYDSFSVMTTFNVKDKEAAKFTTLLDKSQCMYMNEGSLYLVNSIYTMAYGNAMEKGRYSYIVKYAINKDEIKFSACNRVPGSILNQFSMDENKGYFRIATNKNFEQGNNVYILDSQLRQAGKIEGLAKGESIYSVRFDGDRGYVVTFEQVDPLFVLDLSNVKEPKVLGQLKIPGFSQYLHPIGENLVVGIGRATVENISRDEEGNEYVSGIMPTGIKLSLFDVKDPKTPKEINHIVIGDSLSYESAESPALEDHTSIMVDPKRQVLAIPVYLSFGEEKEITNTIKSDCFVGAYVFGVEGGKLVGKAKLGQVDIDTGEYRDFSYYYYYGGDIGRICYIGDKMYYVYGNQINAYDLNNFKRLQVIGLN